MKIEIRELDSIDVKVYAAPLKVLFGYLNPVDANLQDFYQWLKASGQLFGAFGPSNQLLGIATIIMMPKPYHHPNNFAALLEDVAVMDEWRGKGVASELVRFCVLHAESRGCYKCLLTCKDQLIPLYQSCGFRHTDNLMRIDLNGL
jgi:GNAT superfamily N-acetyltransferase